MPLAFANQVFEMQPDQKLEAKVSLKDHNRILVKGDRIQSVIGPKENMSFDSNAETGQVFIQIMDQNTLPFTLSITTEGGREQDLFLIPEDIPSETIILKPVDIEEEKETLNYKTSTHKSEILRLLKLMANTQKGDGYHNKSTDEELKVWSDLKLVLREVYRGEVYEGYKIELQNLKSTDIVIDPILLVKSIAQASNYKVAALASEQDKLGPLKKTYLFAIRVRS